MKRLGEYEVSAKYRMRKHREMMELRKYNEKMSFLKKIINKLKNNKMS